MIVNKALTTFCFIMVCKVGIRIFAFEIRSHFTE